MAWKAARLLVPAPAADIPRLELRDVLALGLAGPGTAAQEDGKVEDGDGRIRTHGQVVHKRKLSRRIVFLDIEDVEGNVLELLLKAEPHLTEDQVHALRDCIKVGDVVDSQGILEFRRAGLILAVSKIAVLERWADKHPGLQFAPHQPKVSRSGTLGDQPCKFWINNKSCLRGESCPYVHHVSNAEANAAVQESLAKKRAARAHALQLAGDPHGLSDKQNKVQRAKIFCSWLLDRFGGVERLSQGSGILDVAGGRGNVGFELCTRNGVPCTTIDPREQKFNREQHLILQGLGNTARLCSHVQEEFGPALWQSPEHHELLYDCSLVLGMHPDEATEAIVDFALMANKPFAVIPCCVFPGLFPNRTLSAVNGVPQPVVTYEQFVAFLLAKDPRIQLEYLPFIGRNQVLYCTAMT
eukprot:jgi/Chlat1/279/Chrsp1S03056